MLKVIIIIIAAIIISIPVLSGGQYVYFSQNGDCAIDGIGCWQYANTYHIFIKAPGITDAYGVTFQFKSDVFGPEDISALIPHEGVVVQSGDLHSGITLVWPPGEYSYDTLLTITTENNEPHPITDWLVGLTKEVKLYRVSTDPLELVDFEFTCSHCYQSSAWVRWQHPDTMLAIIDGNTILEIMGIGYSNGGIDVGEFNISDEHSWLSSNVECTVYCYCPPCWWDFQYISIDVTVPSDVLEGAVSKVSIEPVGPCCMNDSSSFYIRATSEVPVENVSWGIIKALFGVD